jgi:hypothetical protein
MRTYIIVLSIDSQIEMANLKRYIKTELKAPDTAAKYIEDLKASIQKLSLYADAVGTNEYVQHKFGLSARHITFKKMAIIFRIRGKYVYIKQIIPMSLIY